MGVSPNTETVARTDGLVPAREGSGPTLQRDYWAQIRGSRIAASQMGELLSRRFADMVPFEIARFSSRAGPGRSLEVGDELEVWIRFAGRCGVRLVHKNANSLTFATLAGHPESGRITFAAYRHASGNLVLHIRSRARASTPFQYVGFHALGRAMQTETWTRFIDRLAATIGGKVVDFVYEETRHCPDEGPETDRLPTFVAEGD